MAIVYLTVHGKTLRDIRLTMTQLEIISRASASNKYNEIPRLTTPLTVDHLHLVRPVPPQIPLRITFDHLVRHQLRRFGEGVNRGLANRIGLTVVTYV